MSFPIVQSADTKNGTVIANSNSWTLTYPTNIAAGDLLLAFLGCDGNPGVTGLSGWTDPGIFSTDGACIVAAYIKMAIGNETGNFTFGLTANEQGGWRVFRITNWSGLIDFHGIDGSAVSGGGSTQNPDPPSLNPIAWDIEDTLWIAAIGVDTSRTVSSYPVNYDLNQSADVSGGSGGATLGIAMRQNRVASENPGTFTISASDDWGAITVAIRPSSVSPSSKSDFIPAKSSQIVSVNRASFY